MIGKGMTMTGLYWVNSANKLYNKDVESINPIKQIYSIVPVGVTNIYN